MARDFNVEVVRSKARFSWFWFSVLSLVSTVPVCVLLASCFGSMAGVLDQGQKSALGWTMAVSIFVAGLVWIAFAVLWQIKPSFRLKLQKGVLSLHKGSKQLQRVDLNQPHHMLIILKRSRKDGLTKRWAEVFVKQKSQAMCFGIFVSVGTKDPGHKIPEIRCAVQHKGYAYYYSEEHRYNAKQEVQLTTTSAFGYSRLLLLDSFAENNLALARIPDEAHQLKQEIKSSCPRF